MTAPERAQPTAAAVFEEMARIRRLFQRTDEDTEDLISYAQRVTALLAEKERLEARMSELEGALREIERIVPNHPAGEIARAALNTEENANDPQG
jgi:predicted ATP-dependent protease